MEKWGKVQPRRGDRKPSFSSTLLDAIYRSMDEPDAAAIPPPQSRPTTTIPTTKRTPPPIQKPSPSPAPTRPRRSPQPLSTTSSDTSSYSSFSTSSSSDSAPAHLRPIRTGPVQTTKPKSVTKPPSVATDLPSKYNLNHTESTKPCSIRTRLRDMGRSSSKPPASPGARLAGFINSIISAAARNPRKSKTKKSNSVVSLGGGSGDESTCSTASSYYRSCLSSGGSGRTCSSAAKRTVRFCPERRVVLGFGDEESDSSDDLFELENLGSYSYRDELPVYETTRFISVKK